jgi:hypothetical protein
MLTIRFVVDTANGGEKRENGKEHHRGRKRSRAPLGGDFFCLSRRMISLVSRYVFVRRILFDDAGFWSYDDLFLSLLLVVRPAVAVLKMHRLVNRK